MEVLNIICYACSALFVGVLFLVTLVTFFLSVWSCFTKKVQGTLVTKLTVAFVLGCLSPWLLKLTIFLVSKLFV